MFKEVEKVRERLKPSRLVAYVAGLLLLALGIAASMRSDLGSSPVASVPFMFNLTTGLEMGLALSVLWV